MKAYSSGDPATSKILVANLPLNYTQSDLTNLLSIYGKVKSCTMVGDGKDSLKGGLSAHVQYYDSHTLSEARKSLNGMQIDGHVLSVTYLQDPNANPTKTVAPGIGLAHIKIPGNQFFLVLSFLRLYLNFSEIMGSQQILSIKKKKIKAVKRTAL